MAETPDPESTQQITEAFKHLGVSLSETIKKVAEPFKITAEQIAKAFDVPLETLLPPGTPDYPAQVAAIQAGDYPSPPLADCLANNSPYVNNQLGINSYLAAKTQAAKAPVMVAQLDEHGAPTGKMIKLGSVSDFSFTSDLIATPEDAKAVGLGSLTHLTATVDLGPVDTKTLELVYGVDLAQAGDPEIVTVYKQHQHQAYYALGHAQPIIVTSGHWDPEPEYLEGSGDPFEKTGPKPFVLTEPVTPKSPTFQPPYGWFCDACKVHWNAHTGDPVECDSGGYVRKATSAEHKRWLLSKQP